MTMTTIRWASVLIVGLLLTGCTPSVQINSLATLDEVEGIAVDVTTTGSTGSAHLDVTITNSGDRQWLVDWDRSSYVRPDGKPGRLLTSMAVDDQEQIPTPLPPGSTLRQVCRNRLLAGRTADTAPRTATLNLALVDGDERCFWRGVIELERTPERRRSGHKRVD